MTNVGHNWIALLLVIATCGCSTGPFSCLNNDPSCPQEPGSCEWWSVRAMAPPGVRQRCHKGKNWPVRPRPTGEPQQFSHIYHSATYWPLPYVCQDREYIRNITEIQRANGWRQQMTLYHRHFDASQMLTVPGRLHLTDVLELSPMEFRTVEIQASFNPEIDSARIANVRQAIAELTGGMEDVPVEIRQARDYSRPASEVQMINDLYDSSIPAPRLIGAGGGGGGGMGAAAGGLSAGP